MVFQMYWVYILSSTSGTLYVGITNDLNIRVVQHATKSSPKSFTARYNVHKLVYFESYSDVRAAIAREKQLKGYRRSKKIALIEEHNPHWVDLYPGL